jgi:hypothetical protein
VGESGSGWGGFIAAGRSGSALGRQQRPTSERGQTSLGWRRGDVGGLASSRTGVETEWAGEGSLVFPLGGLATVDANF